MTRFFETLRDAARRRAAYNRTVAELRSLPIELAVEDLGIFPGDARNMARSAVYGR
ncbi:hypothetical protein [Anianabacter salinae]|uniref:hypothetical protein n=1 Tax=Anianabacter salinae TaxID=2851023 RepID=UPI00225E30DF|nr:hypothetical protein [Anianabacter salinae]MBV0911530.1 hypothetical protein [Anianabacter salinae]